MVEARHALRSVLRVVNQHLTKVNNNKLWRDHIIQQFRQAAKSDPAEQQQMLQQAKDYAYLVTSVQEHRVRTIKAAELHGSLKAFLMHMFMHRLCCCPIILGWTGSRSARSS